MKRNKSIRTELLRRTGEFKQLTEADKIIAFIENKDGKSTLPVNLQKKLERYKFVHGLRLRYKQHSYIIGHLFEFYKRNERQARHDIAEAEYIFGKAINVSIKYERYVLLQISIKNIEIAMLSKDVNLITKALLGHHTLLGKEEDESDMPDASDFQQHTFNMILPDSIADMFKNMISQGAIDLNKIIPNKMLQISSS
ncbi:MAG: hypothetical protein V4608_03345 [Bacteroidota bacterium]